MVNTITVNAQMISDLVAKTKYFKPKGNIINKSLKYI